MKVCENLFLPYYLPKRTVKVVGYVFSRLPLMQGRRSLNREVVIFLSMCRRQKMKRKLMWRFLFFLFTLAAMPAWAQIRYEATWRGFAVGASDYYVDFFLRAMPGQTVEKIGNLTLFLNYNTSELTYVGLVAGFDGPWDYGNTGIPSPSYNQVFAFNRQANSRFSINFAKADGADPLGGVAPVVCPTRIGRVRFTRTTDTPSLSFNTQFCGLTNYDDLTDITAQVSLPDAPPVLCQDFGDIPATYSTPAAGHDVQGIVTNQTPIYRLGAVVPDYESTPATPLDGTGDDVTGSPDDEEGVTFPTLAEGVASSLSVSFSKPSGATAYLMAWFDWNNDGDFIDPGELAANVALTTQTSPVTISVTPPAGSAGSSYARFRISSSSTMTPIVYAMDGEVEDYPVTILDVFDFGDAPASYGTATAYHSVPSTPTLYLGSTIPDVEPAPCTPADGTGDDVTATDDEEGVITPTHIVPNVAGNWRISFVKPVSGTQYLRGWVDWNRDGDFLDSGELIVDTPLTGLSSPYVIGVLTPATASVGVSYARFRISTTAAMTPTADYSDGEIEDYAIVIEPVSGLQKDFGDVPSSYGTTTALHLIPSPTQIYFGAAAPDNEAAPAAPTNGTGDDVTGTDDEEGIQLPAIFPTGQNSSVTIAFTRPVGPVIYIRGWFDWNQDGDFLDSGEQGIDLTLTTQISPQIVTVAVPAGALTGASYARFRISDVAIPGGMTPVIGYDTGEIEDYPISVQTPADYGDAPASYGTNTAVHSVPTTPNLYLGVVAPDLEVTPSIPLDGSGDDVTETDDEEGITLPAHIVAGVAANWTVRFVKPVTGTQYLRGWVDWNRDGDFLDTGELVIDTPLTSITSPYTVGILAPSTAIVGASYARFRVSENATLTPIQSAGNGEIEDYAIAIEPISEQIRDYGDAPDSYGTTSAVVHLLHSPPTIYLGTVIPDNETTPALPLNGTGDDVNGTDDEEALLSSPVFVTGSTGSVTIAFTKPSGALVFLRGWIDWNRDGDLLDVGELAVDLTLTSQTSPQTLNFTVPPGAVPGSSYLRLRITDVVIPGGMTPVDGYDTGEVEDFPITIQAPSDFGDAPTSYGTATASHVIPSTPTLYLGTISPDAEAGPATPLDGSGDDVTGTDDEGGVVTPVHIVPGVAGNWMVIFTRPAGTQYLRGWIDWNRDGDFLDSGELMVDVTLTTQTSPLLIGLAAPGTASTGASYARFRISSTTGMTPSDSYNDGEIEDYAIIIEPPGGLQKDFGDVPTSYGTNTALHLIPSPAQIYLGSVAPDNENTPSTPLDATGDDVVGTDDEGGVTLPAAFIGGQNANVTISFTKPAGPIIYLRAWFDWNRDGDFLDNGEMGVDLTLTTQTSPQTVAVSVPASTPDGTSYARFRISDVAVSGGMTPIFGFDTGEVEDYAITLMASNQPPYAINDINNTTLNTAVTGNVLTNDWDPNGDALTVTTTPVSTPSHGTVTLSANGNYTYTPTTGYVGEDVFSYQVCDNGTPSLCDQAVVAIEIVSDTNDNNAPIANDDAVQTLMNIAIPGNVLTNDLDPDDDPLTVTTTPVVLPSHGAVILNTDGTFTYTPTTGYLGEDSWEYQVCDNGSPALCDLGTVTVTIVSNPAGNDPPVAVDDAATTDPNIPVSGNLAANDYDPNGDPMTVTTAPVSGPSHGAVTITIDGSFTYTPQTGYTGPDQFIYRICDNQSACDVATAYITIQNNNRPPIAIDDINNTIINMAVTGNVLTNDWDPDNNSLTVTTTPVVSPAHGTVALNSNGSYTYTPTTGYIGEDTFTYQVCDNGAPSLCDQAVVTVEIVHNGQGNTAPIANDDAVQGLVNNPVYGNVLTNDLDPDGTVLTNPTVTTLPIHGTVSLSAGGVFTYTPATDYVGTDTWQYQICDDGTPVLCDVAVVSVTIYPNQIGNDPPFAVDDAATTRPNTPVSGNVAVNDYDPNGDPLIVNTTPVSNPVHGTVALNAAGNFTYTPTTGYIGPDQFIYQICDNGTPPLCDQATAYITVQNVGDFGDAPSTYGSATAMHIVASTPVLYLGAIAPDIESAPSTPLDGSGDDVTGTDDEEGVTVPLHIVQGVAGNWQIRFVKPATGTFYLRGWVDWNRDGDFLDAGETIVNTSLTGITSPYTVGILAPASASVGLSYARFRISSTSGMTPSAGYGDGEIEDLAITIEALVQNRDYGDAPISYNNSLPAVHLIPASPTIYLGAVAPDAETGPSSPQDGSGDDVSNIDDEDGVVLPVEFEIGQNTQITISFTKPSGSLVFLRGWFDWNRDGDFLDDGELGVDLTLVAQTSPQTLTITAPIGSVVGASYARFRISDVLIAGGMTPTHGYENGEIEDYQIALRYPRATVFAKVFLEGAYDANIQKMVQKSGYRAILDTLRRDWTTKFLTQDVSIPLNKVPNIVDFILIALRSSATSTMEEMAIGFVTTDGYLYGLDGEPGIRFNADGGNYYIVIMHQNHLAIQTANAVDIRLLSGYQPGQFIDLTVLDNIYQKPPGSSNNEPIKAMLPDGSGIHAMFAGNAHNAGGWESAIPSSGPTIPKIVYAIDAIPIQEDSGQIPQYTRSDTDLSGVTILALDFIFVQQNSGIASEVPTPLKP